jgi:hypothetical protein
VNIRRTLILLIVFLAALAAVLFFESREKKQKSVKEKQEMLLDIASDSLKKISIKREDMTLTLEKNDKGEWTITEPLAARADSYEASSLADNFGRLRPDKVVEKEAGDPTAYEIPKKEVLVWAKDREKPYRLLIGMDNPIDNSIYAKLEDDPRIVLLPSYLKTSLEKKLIDLRDKSVFQFESADVKTIRVRSGETEWEARRAEDGWSFESPFRAQAKKSSLDSILSSLAGLRAKDFLAEDKTADDLKKYGLDKPAIQVSLAMPAADKTVVFSFQKKGDATYATSSASNKIVSCDGYVLSDLEKKPADLREKQVASFYSWEAEKLAVKREGLALTAVREKTKDGGERWTREGEPKKELDKAKVDEFLRKLEYLEAAEFIDNPGALGPYGLDKPAVEIEITTRGSDDKTSLTKLLVGRTDEEKKQVILKNAKFDYLFRVDAAFLDLLPKDENDWLAAVPESKAAAPAKEDKGEKK